MPDSMKFACLLLLTISFQICIAHDLHNIRDSLGKLLKYVTSCDQNLDCKTSGVAGTFVPDPADCHNYYTCILSDQNIVASDSPISCPSGQYFNADSSVCEDEVQPCNNTCDSRCSFVCTAELDLVPNPGNCSIYEICLIGGGTQLESCPPTLPYFNGVDCSADSSSCCDTCSLNCVEVGVKIPDPCDCHMYYICNALGVPPESQHSSCSSDDHFDPNLGTCVAGRICQPHCTSSFCDNTATIITTIRATTATEITTSSVTLTNGFTYKVTYTTATSTELTTTISLCINAMSCTETGKFAKCPFCYPDYFLCSEKGEQAIDATCPSGEVFNPVPEYQFYLATADCPYPSSA